MAFCSPTPPGPRRHLKRLLDPGEGAVCTCAAQGGGWVQRSGKRDGGQLTGIYQRQKLKLTFRQQIDQGHEVLLSFAFNKAQELD